MSSWEGQQLSLALGKRNRRPWMVRLAPGGLAKLSGYVSVVLWSAVAWVGLVKMILVVLN